MQWRQLHEENMKQEFFPKLSPYKYVVFTL